MLPSLCLEEKNQSQNSHERRARQDWDKSQKGKQRRREERGQDSEYILVDEKCLPFLSESASQLLHEVIEE